MNISASVSGREIEPGDRLIVDLEGGSISLVVDILWIQDGKLFLSFLDGTTIQAHPDDNFLRDPDDVARLDRKSQASRRGQTHRTNKNQVIHIE
jgi:hypothetical protein